MDNRGSYRDSDRDHEERDQQHDASSPSSQRRQKEEEKMTYYRSQIVPRTTNITNRVTPTSNNIVIERFFSHGIGPGVPLKPGGKSAAVVAIQ